MAKLYFRHGAMGCSKTANALMVAFNYEEKGLNPLVLKPKMENRDGATIIRSRIGLERECQFVEDFIVEDEAITLERTKPYDVVIIDEVQFCTLEQIRQLKKIVVYNKIPVITYGLTNDFKLEPFVAARELMIQPGCKSEELKTVCWCGDGATCNARLDEKGKVLYDGPQILLGGNNCYTSLCLEHYLAGDIGPKMRAKFVAKNSK